MSHLILGIDTSSAWGSLGLIDSKGLLVSTTVRIHEGHAKGLMTRIEKLFEETKMTPRQLTTIGVVNGPGSFTALRVGVSSAQGLGMALKIPVVPIGSLEAIAAGVPVMQGDLHVLIPARKGEVFVQSFINQQGIGWISSDVVKCLRIEEYAQIIPSQESLTETIYLAGPAVELYAEELEALLGSRNQFLPYSCRYARGEMVADLARKYLTMSQDELLLLGRDSDMAAEKVEICYLQSHGALTIKEREKTHSRLRVNDRE